MSFYIHLENKTKQSKCKNNLSVTEMASVGFIAFISRPKKELIVTTFLSLICLTEKLLLSSDLPVVGCVVQN